MQHNFEVARNNRWNKTKIRSSENPKQSEKMLAMPCLVSMAKQTPLNTPPL
jgi:hypothetical protein